MSLQPVTDPAILKAHARDQSMFDVMPSGVFFPASISELKEIVQNIADRARNDEKVSLTARAGGTGLSGGSLNTSYIVNVNEHLNRIVNTDPTNFEITVEPGVPYKTLTDHLRTLQQEMPIFPSSWRWCSVGGMVGNNAAGENTLKYGAQDMFVKRLRTILADGNEYELRPLTWPEAQSICNHDSWASTTFKKIYQLVKDNWQEIYEHRPKASKDTSGYALWKLFTTSPTEFENGHGYFDLTKLFVGSQGTLGLTTSITYRTQTPPARSNLVVVPIKDIAALSSTVGTIMATNPEKIELFDRTTLTLARDNLEDFKKAFPHNFTDFSNTWQREMTGRFKNSGDPEMMLLVEWTGQSNEFEAAITQTLSALPTAYQVKDPFTKSVYWATRYQSLALVSKHAKDQVPAGFLEDIVVPLEHFSMYYPKLLELISRENLTCAIHGHAGNVHLHFYPLIDFTAPDISAKIEDLCHKFFTLAASFNGSISGEHNDGIIRTPFLSYTQSPLLLKLYQEVKTLFDPYNIFNPGKKVGEPLPIKDYLRHDNTPSPLGAASTKNQLQ